MDFTGLLAFLLFSRKFPFVKFRKRYLPNEYHKVSINKIIPDDNFKKLLAENKELLLINQVPLDKIRFTSIPRFIYDIDKDIVNPVYDIFVPLREDGSGLFDKRVPVIEINKPSRLIGVSVNSYCISDNYQFIKNKLQKSKRGIVIFLADEFIAGISDFSDEKIKLHFHYSVDTTVLRLANLDEEVEKYNIEMLDIDYKIIK